MARMASTDSIFGDFSWPLLPPLPYFPSLLPLSLLRARLVVSYLGVEGLPILLEGVTF